VACAWAATARGGYAGPMRHSVGRKVAGDAILQECCNPDTRPTAAHSRQKYLNRFGAR
jgi:hypothetical protein